MKPDAIRAVGAVVTVKKVGQRTRLAAMVAAMAARHLIGPGETNRKTILPPPANAQLGGHDVQHHGRELPIGASEPIGFGNRGRARTGSSDLCRRSSC